jgi:hypothetical protein
MPVTLITSHSSSHITGMTRLVDSLRGSFFNQSSNSMDQRQQLIVRGDDDDGGGGNNNNNNNNNSSKSSSPNTGKRNLTKQSFFMQGTEPSAQSLMKRESVGLVERELLIHNTTKLRSNRNLLKGSKKEKDRDAHSSSKPRSPKPVTRANTAAKKLLRPHKTKHRKSRDKGKPQRQRELSIMRSANGRMGMVDGITGMKVGELDDNGDADFASVAVKTKAVRSVTWTGGGGGCGGGGGGGGDGGGIDDGVGGVRKMPPVQSMPSFLGETLNALIDSNQGKKGITTQVSVYLCLSPSFLLQCTHIIIALND